MIMKNNRIADALPLDAAVSASSEIKPPSWEDLTEYAARAREWAKTHPVSCLATAFAAGVAIAWIIKRK